jgi:hypothetical protein
VTHRHLTTAVTMLVLVAILVGGVVLGVDKLFAPLPKDSQASSDPTSGCTTQTLKKGQKVRAREVQVSVFNGGTRAGLADQTMNQLVRRGFKRGDVGNAPSDVAVRRVQVWSSDKHSVAAKLVARQFGPRTKVRRTKTDLGAGIDIVVGNGLRSLHKAPKVMVVRKTSSVCVPESSTAAG